VAAPEEILALPEEGRAMPDVLVDFRGLRTAIEGEFAPPEPCGIGNAQRKARRAALKRVERGIAQVGVAVVYPCSLRTAPPESMKAELSQAALRFAIITESTQARTCLFPELEEEPGPFTSGDLNALVEALRRAYEQLVRDEVLELAVRRVETGIGLFTDALRGQPGSIGRFRQVLEMREPPGQGAAERPGARGRRGQAPARPDPREQAAVNRVSALILTNAMVFQQVLASHDARVKGLACFRNHGDTVADLAHHWWFILKEINYYPIFHIAHDLLTCVVSYREVTTAIQRLMDTAACIVLWHAPLRHDLAGRLYHRLLADAKHLGAFYTAIPSAALLLKLALEPGRWDVDWRDLSALKRFRIADFACGTGTLLMATADGVVDNYVRARAQSAQRLRIGDLQKVLVSEMLYGFDVLDSAVHLTASTLALRSPDVPVDVTHLGRRALGGQHAALGSLDFLESHEIGALFSSPEWIAGKKAVEAPKPRAQRLPKVDLCVMNPPFTRSVGGNLLFGNLPDTERAELQRKLKDIVKRRGLSASITAGLGSVFFALGDQYLKEGGRLAFIVPRALLSGVAWGRTRELIGSGYHLEWIVASHEPNHWNFSENTDLSEVLVVARKREAPADEERVTCVNLWRQPRNSVEALTIAGALSGNPAPDVRTDQGALELNLDLHKMGEALSVPWPWLRERLWGFPCAYAQAEAVRALFHLLDRRLYVPARGQAGRVAKLPLCPLNELGELGFDCRDMHDGFSLSLSVTDYPAFWSHDAGEVRSLEEEPNRYLAPRPRPQPGRPLRRATDLWRKAGRVLLAERLWLKTMRLAAIRTRQEVLSNVWWPFVFRRGGPEAEKALVLWLNSSPGLVLLVGHREETRGAWVKFKKPVLGAMPVLDVRKLGRSALTRLAGAFDQLSCDRLLPFPLLDQDPTRAAIDAAVAEALGLPDLAPLRTLLAREPILSLSLDRLLPS